MALLAGAAVAAGASGGTANAGTSLVTGAAWSGYVVRPGPYYSVSAEFTVPDGACSQCPGESGRWTGFWVGFQGDGAIAQDGFIVSCANGRPEYHGSHAQNDGTIIPIPKPMQPGDQVRADVICWSAACSQTVQDVTANWADALLVPVPAGFSGWIAAVPWSRIEEFGGSADPSALADFLRQLQDLAQAATTARSGVYCRISV